MNLTKRYKNILKTEYGIFVKKVKIDFSTTVYVPYQYYSCSNGGGKEAFGEKFYLSLEMLLKDLKEKKSRGDTNE